MGANFVCKDFPVCEQSDLRQKVSSICDQKRYEDGHGGYTGTWAEKNGGDMIIKTSPIFPCSDAAYDYLSEENDDKHEPLMAVRYVAGMPKMPASLAKKLEDTEQKMAATSRELFQFPDLILKRMQSAKNAFRGCKGCNSRLAIAHLSQPVCPLCGHTLLTDSDLKVKARIEAKFEQLQASHQVLIAKKNAEALKKPNHLRWLVGGLCAS